MNENYDVLIESFDKEDVYNAIQYCREIVALQEVRPTYCEDPATFMPHAWVVAAVAGLIVEARAMLEGVVYVEV
jgi:hypothetical protein